MLRTQDNFKSSKQDSAAIDDGDTGVQTILKQLL
jgi:hypothetical protein